MRVVILIFITLILTNCNKRAKSEVSNEDVNGEYEMADASKSVAERRPVVHVVEIVEMKFVPDVVNAHEGDTVVWVNNDMVIHDVTEQYHKKWTSSAIPLKKSWKMVVTGSADYYCSLHLVMKGKIVVN